MRSLLSLLLGLFVVSCTPVQPPPPPLALDQILVSSEPIKDASNLPEFGEHFEEGKKVMYVYAVMKNVESLTDTYVVQMDWHSPNDLSPPIRRTNVELTPPQYIAQFELHDGAGMKQAPHKVNIRSGTGQGFFTSSGSTRFFIGMTPEEASQFVSEEEAYLAERDRLRAESQAEEERQKALSGAVLEEEVPE